MRCYICDYSETGDNDPILHSSIDISTKVLYDESIGKYVCDSCLGVVYETVKDFNDQEEEEVK